MHAILIALALSATPAAPQPLPEAAPQVAVVVCPESLRPALAPWIAHREAQGYTLRLLPSQPTPEALRERIGEVATREKARFVVLVGDVGTAAGGVPAFVHEAKVNVLFGGGPDIASDNGYGDLDGDQVPELAVGRLSADTPAELAAMVDKILAYERTGGMGPWRRRLNFVIGLGRFGPVMDTALETATRHLLTTTIPESYEVWVTLANWQSPYCPNPLALRQTAIERLNEGSAFWIYVGHGKSSSLDRMHVPGARIPIFEAADVPRLRAERMPIALFLACSTGAFDRPEDCLAERMVRQRGGPVAAIAGSRVTMPYAMAILGLEMIQEYFGRQPKTLGEVFLAAKQGSVRKGPGSPTRQMLDSMAGLLSPNAAALGEERREHLLLFNLLGDPTLRLTQPAAVRIDVPKTVEPGGSLAVTIDSPLAGRATVELIRPRGQLGFAPPARPEYPKSRAALAAFQNVYHRANDSRITIAERTVPTGPSPWTLAVPKETQGKCFVRVHVEGVTGYALGAVPVSVVAKPPEDSDR